MRAMVLEALGGPLLAVERPLPPPRPGEVRLRIEACAVCRTDLHVIDGDLPLPKLPLIPGHEIVGSSRRWVTMSTRQESAVASVCPGSAIPAGHVPIADRARRISVTTLCSPATPVMAASPRMPLRTQTMLSISTPKPIPYPWRRCSAPA